MDDNAKQQIAERLIEANNVLVTVSSNPSVDQLAACIGLTLLLNKLGKHGSAVFSGAVPSTIEYLQPDKILEKNTNSLRDFIIALDKSKADKLRYKVEDKIVKIFITPYRTSLSQDDLEFSQGDFNVDAVLALGVHEREDLDEAITAHGRILHDATVISVNNRDQGNLGTINWVDVQASSLCEMLASLAKDITKEPLDAQMATAFMTGIVAETERFSNEKTTPQTMTIASRLLSSGANQQLIATKLEAAQPIPELEPANDGVDYGRLRELARKSKQQPGQPLPNADSANGALQIDHPGESAPTPNNASQSLPQPSNPFQGSNPPANERPEPSPLPPLPPTGPEHKQRVIQPPAPPRPLPSIDDALAAEQAQQGPVVSRSLVIPQEQPRQMPPAMPQGMPSSMVLEPPLLGGRLTANTEPESDAFGQYSSPFSLPNNNSQMLNRGMPSAPSQMQQPLPPLPQTQQTPFIPAGSQPLPTPASELPSLPPQPPQLQPAVPSYPQTPSFDAPQPAPQFPVPPTPQPPASGDSQTLQKLEEEIGSPHLHTDDIMQSDSIEEAREAVDQAINQAGESNPEPLAAVGAQPFGASLHEDDQPEQSVPGSMAGQAMPVFNGQPDPGMAMPTIEPQHRTMATPPPGIPDAGLNTSPMDLPTPPQGGADPFAPSMSPAQSFQNDPMHVNGGPGAPPPAPPPLAPL